MTILSQHTILITTALQKVVKLGSVSLPKLFFLLAFLYPFNFCINFWIFVNFCKKSPFSIVDLRFTAGFLNLSIVGIFGQIILCFWGTVLCILVCLAASSGFYSIYISSNTSRFGNQECLWILLNVLQGSKALLIENHQFRL